MKRSGVEVGGKYWMRMDGRTIIVKITFAHSLGGWTAIDEDGRELHVTSARLGGKA